MIEEERQKARKCKEEVYGRMRIMKSRWKSAKAVHTDERIWTYIEGVIDHPEAHNLYEALGVERFFRLLSDYAWDAAAVTRFFKFYEAIRFNGANGRQRYKLTPVQCFQFASIFGFRKSDGYRLTRTAYLFVPRKFSKTTSSASLAVYDLLFGDNNAQAYVAANSYTQASICFKEIRNIISDLDRRGKHFRVNRETVMFIDKKREAFASCLSSNPKTLDGLNASTVIMDEYAQARNTRTKSGAELKNVLVTSMGTRLEPLVIIITTASDVLDGPFYEELKYVLKILRGESQDDSIFASIFMPDVDDEESSMETWKKVQPHMGVTVRKEFYENAWKDAQRTADDMLAFRTKLLNIFCINEAKRWFTADEARRITGNFDIDKVKGLECSVAFDLSVKDDFSAVTYTVYSSKTKMFYCHTEYYFPEGSMANHVNRDLYTTWAQAGYLKICKGERIDTKMIREDILRRSKKVKIIVISYDSYKAQDLTNDLAAVGAREVLKPFSQTYGSFNLAVESMEMLAYSDPPRIMMNDNPINVFCLTNCVVDIDRMENKKPMKAEQTKKIDGAITMLMTIGAMYNYERY